MRNISNPEKWSFTPAFIILFVGMIILGVYASYRWKQRISSPYCLTEEVPYYDEAGVLSDEVKNKIYRINNDYKYDEVQLGVVVLKSLNGRNMNFVADEVCSDSLLFLEAGQLILISADEQIYEIINYGNMKKTTKDYEIKTIKDIMLPYFSEQNYNEGIIAGFDEIESKFRKYSKYNIMKELKSRRSYVHPVIPNPNR